MNTSRGRSGGVKAVPAPQARGWLGLGIWADQQNFWNMELQFGESLFTQDLPDSCFVEAQCPAVHSSEFRSFSSVDKWTQYYSSKFGVSAKVGYYGFTESISASVGSTISNIARSQRELTYAASIFQKKCYALIQSEGCTYNQSSWADNFKQRLKELPHGSPYDEEKMMAWKTGFIQAFGTHIAVESSHGAKIQALTSMDSRHESAKDCTSSSICSSFGFILAESSNDCQISSNTTSCDDSSSLKSSLTEKCVAVGGKPSEQFSVSGAKASAQEIEKWVSGANVDTDSSAINYDLIPISELLNGADLAYQPVADTLQKAVEYANCLVGQKPPLQEWIDGKCQCVRECENGGTLNPSSCTCECRGDVQHGWVGVTCSETYGKCQPGPGTGNPSAADRCPLNNRCSPDWGQKTCEDTDVCCATDFGAKCCPFGNTCDCGAGSCDCVAPS